MEFSKFERIVKKYQPLLLRLEKNRKLLVSDCVGGGRLQDLSFAEKNAGFFQDSSEDAVCILLDADFIQKYPHPVLIDFKKAVELYCSSNIDEEERVRTAYLMSRVNFMGTDGMRGKVVLNPDKECLNGFLEDVAFTPALVETVSFSFCDMIIDAGILKKGDTVAVGNDGRDAASGGVLNRSMTDGFLRAGLDVLDIGTAFTALVPFTMLEKGFRGGAMLTASHNPSNQNGIKFFIDGKKLLPEGMLGDFALSAYIYHYCRYAKLPAKTGNCSSYGHTVYDGARLVNSALPAEVSALLRGTTLVLDNANGAFSDTAAVILDSLGIPWTTKNEKPSGANINRRCGVAEIEGIESFHGNAYDFYIPFVKELFDKGRSAAENSIFGISLDGDGDRGFLLYYEKKADCVHVLDGDKCGYILAEYFIRKNQCDPGDFWFISTIESDLMIATGAEKKLGLHSKVVSVGDKWIGNFTGGKMLIGLEVSGHVIFPVECSNSEGMRVFLLSGIGLLTGLLTLAAIRDNNRSSEKIIRPFDPGFSKTFYCFFVDKSKFYRNSAVWKDDCKLVHATVEELKSSGGLPADTRIVLEEKEDPNVLYLSLINSNGLSGCVFMRNSGTEDKNATYVKGMPEIKEELLIIGRRVQEGHIKAMKNKNRVEFGCENLIMKMLYDVHELDLAAVKSAMAGNRQSFVTDSDLLGVVHGLKKEGRISARESHGTTIIGLPNRLHGRL